MDVIPLLEKHLNERGEQIWNCSMKGRMSTDVGFYRTNPQATGHNKHHPSLPAVGSRIPDLTQGRDQEEMSGFKSKAGAPPPGPREALPPPGRAGLKEKVG